MGDKEFTLDELVSRTGFSKRQIRYYITEKLVPGAGEQGPNAAYDEETLERLELIKQLKGQPVGPTGRKMSLAEIRHALDNRAEQLPPGLREGRPDTVTGMLYSPERSLPENRASDYLDDLIPADCVVRQPDCLPALDFSSYRIPLDESSTTDPADENPLDDLLQSLHSLLVDLGSDTPIDSQAGEGDSWRRITSPDVEIQVRTPDNLEARKRLLRMALQIGHLLAREE